LFASLALAAACGSAAAHAMPSDQNYQDQDHHDDHRDGDHRDDHRDDRRDGDHRQVVVDHRDDRRHDAWERGHAVPERYRSNEYVVTDYRTRHLREPPRGYHWIRDEDNNFLLVAVTTGVILDLALH
jgi:Ni/Co efflux regulator RcnB